MSPITKISKNPDGTVKITEFRATEKIRVCLEFDMNLITDVYFEDMQTFTKSYMVVLQNAVAVNVGLHNGEAFYQWMWAWENMEEAEAAWRQIPAALDLKSLLDELVNKIDGFVSDNNHAVGDSKIVLNITPELKNIGWETILLDDTKDEVSRAYNMGNKAISRRKDI